MSSEVPEIFMVKSGFGLYLRITSVSLSGFLSPSKLVSAYHSALGSITLPFLVNGLQMLESHRRLPEIVVQPYVACIQRLKVERFDLLRKQ